MCTSFRGVFLCYFSRRLEVIEKERSPQILAIHHGGEDETDEDEGEGFVGDDDRGEEEHCDRLDSSLDSSFHSLSPGEFSLNASDYESVVYFSLTLTGNKQTSSQLIMHFSCC